MGQDSVPEELLELRLKIDGLDRKLVELLADRFSLTHAVGMLKASNVLEPVDTKREAEKLAEIRGLCAELNVDADLVAELFTRIMAQAVKNHKQIKQKQP